MSKRMRSTGHVARMGRIGMHSGFLWKTRSKETLGIPRRGWENNIKMDVRETCLVNMHWINLAEDMGQRRPLVNTVMNLQVP
jgi:hypothetical protein